MHRIYIVFVLPFHFIYIWHSSTSNDTFNRSCCPVFAAYLHVSFLVPVGSAQAKSRACLGSNTTSSCDPLKTTNRRLKYHGIQKPRRVVY